MASHNNSFVPKVSFEAIQTVASTKITEPRRTRQVLAGELVGPGIFQSCLNMVQYYRNENEEDAGWRVAGWIKESLGRAMSDQPLMGGRLRKGERNEGEMEIVSNDCGIRLIEATIQMNLSEFLGSKQRDEAEAQLVFWKDIDEQNPQFSPLFYVQVTYFRCGGFSIGISCTILLADILLRTEFLKTWANIYNNVINNKNNERNRPVFYLPSLRNATSPSPNITSSNSSKNSVKTMIFKINAESESLGIEWCRKVALACLKDAENNLGSEMGAEFCLFVNESFEVIKVETCSKHGKLKPPLKLNKEITVAKWDDFGVHEVSFRGGDQPVHVSKWCKSILGGAAIIIPSLDDIFTVNIIVAIPNEKF